MAAMAKRVDNPKRRRAREPVLDSAAIKSANEEVTEALSTIFENNKCIRDEKLMQLILVLTKDESSDFRSEFAIWLLRNHLATSKMSFDGLLADVAQKLDGKAPQAMFAKEVFRYTFAGLDKRTTGEKVNQIEAWIDSFKNKFDEEKADKQEWDQLSKQATLEHIRELLPRLRDLVKPDEAKVDDDSDGDVDDFQDVQVVVDSSKRARTAPS